MDNESFVAAKRRQALRRNEPELREYEQKLRDALVLKEQICQMKEKRHREMLEEVLIRCDLLNVHKREEFKSLQQVLMENEEIQKRAKQQNHSSKLKYGEMLQLQMDLKKTCEMRRGSEILEEKLRLTEMEEKFLQDKLCEHKYKKKLASQLLREMDLFEKLRLAAEREAALTLQEEEHDAKKYEELQAARKLQRYEAFKKKMIGKEILCDSIMRGMLIQRRLREERRQLIENLHFYRYDTRHSNSEKVMENKLTLKTEYLNTLKLQINMHMNRERDLEDEQFLYRKQLLDQLTEEEEAFLEKDYFINLRNIKHRTELEVQVGEVVSERRQREEFKKHAIDFIKQYNKETKRNVDYEKLNLFQEYDRK